MSLMDKVGSLMRRPGEDAVPKDEVPIWMKYGGRALGTVGGAISIFAGLFNCFAILVGGVSCLLAGMWMMVAGFAVLSVEAPCCCFFIDFVNTLSQWADKRPYWQRAGFYMGIAIPPLILCIGFSNIVACGLIFGTGVLYGMMALGKKAPLEEMRTHAAQVDTSTGPWSKSNLVENASPIGTSIPPV